MVVWTPKKMVFIKNSQGYVIVGTVNKPHSSSCGVFFVVGCPKRYVARSLMRVMRGEDARPQNHQRFDTRQTLKLGCGRAVFGKSELLVHESKTTTTVSKKTPTKKKTSKPHFLYWMEMLDWPSIFSCKKMRFIGGVQLKLGWLSSSRQVGLPVTPDVF